MLVQSGFMVLCGLAATGAWLDWRTRRIPNALCATAFLSGAALSLAAHGTSWTGMALIHALLALVIGMALFARGWIGGGDAKFYAGLAAWFPVSSAWAMLTMVSLSGLLMLLLMLPLRRRLKERAQRGGAATADFAKVPYGVAIGAGAVFTGSMIWLAA